MQEIFKKKCRYYNYAIIFTSSQQIVHRAKVYGYVPKTFPMLKNTTRKPQEKQEKSLSLRFTPSQFVFYKSATTKNRGFIEENL